MPSTSPIRRRFPSWRVTARVGVYLLVGYCVVVAILLAREDRLVFHPVTARQRWAGPPARIVVRDIELQTTAGTRVHARWFPRDGAAGAILFCHGRNGNLSRELGLAEIEAWQREIGASVLIFDYPGYGRSSGRPTEAGCYAAADAAYLWLTQVQGVTSSRVLIYGRSLGTAVAVELASRRPHRALVLVAPFTSLPDIALGYFPLLPAHQLMRNRFDNLERIGRCPQPLFIVHGTRDSVVPFAQGEALFAAARAPKQFLTVEGGRHGNCVTTTFFAALRRFLNRSSRFVLGKAGR